MKTNWQVVIKSVIAIIITTALIYGGYNLVTGQPFQVKRVTLVTEANSGPSFLFSQMKESLELRLAHLKGQPVWKIDLEDVLRKIEGDLRVKKAKVSRRLPNEILVTVAPHLPIAAILNGGRNSFVPVSRDGELLPKVATEEAMDLPILRGSLFLKDEKIRQLTVSLLLQMPESGLVSQKNISEVSYDKQHGLKLILIPSGMEVWIGKDDFARRISQVERVVEYMEQKELSGRIVDARFEKKVVVRLRESVSK